MTTGVTVALGLAIGLAAGWVYLFRRSRFAWMHSPGRPEERRKIGAVRTVWFPAIDGTALEGWLFVPSGVRSPPLVVMAPGLGGTKEGFLEPFAWSFVERGLAVLAFDYRCFGGSQGSPRHWVAPPRHREDYEAAIDFARRDLGDVVDGSRIALWGTSFSGGTVLVTAARRSDVRAVVAQCPYLRTPPRLEPHGLALARYVVLTTLDLLHLLGIPIYIPLYGRPGEWAFATSQENPSVADFEGGLGSEFWRLLPRPARGGWDNRMLARGLASLDEAVPMDELAKVRCPVLFVGARHDDMVPYAYVEEAQRRLTTSELVSYDCGHFDLYVGQPHAENARRQADFLARALLLSSLPEGDAPMADELFHDRNLSRARFDDVALSEAAFHNVNLRRATFDDVAFAGATLTNVDLSHVAIREACIEGLTIDGFDVKALIAAERDRRERQGGG